MLHCSALEGGRCTAASVALTALGTLVESAVCRAILYAAGCAVESGNRKSAVCAYLQGAHDTCCFQLRVEMLSEVSYDYVGILLLLTD